MRVVAITACPTGIAHTYMAADKLMDTAKKLGISIKVETQGAMGIENRLSEQDIARADVVVLAADINIEQSARFKNQRCLEVTIQDALQRPRRVFSQCQQLLAH
ncbi:PTS fructose transporter subunit IIB [Photobacterium gaetbulicola]|uniref:protein-N(pi)-phosphohistidine--D-fructose phosphotransferase n=1 Tax=Photobacterium gaetbulicola Gung47 TaxID=658445 RepID=A0A0C5WQ63_9GAMM|nr:PTS fructose transporter subunit IIB [Photobacterium gaetbulicola]AJR05100.1 PTS system, fructose-specific, IIB subunnit [Photobacterium gaetbulicola Gung47]PSU06873.1 PTS fructose transporter subunit IIB [Photobacterium gaetbulicola]